MAEFTRNAPDYLTNAKSRAQSLDRFYDRLRLPPSIRRTTPGPAAAAESVPRANRRSMKCWMMPQAVVNRRNQTAQARKSSKGA